MLNPSKPTYDPHATATDILNDIDVTEQDYQWAISPDYDYELHLKRPIESWLYQQLFYCWIKRIGCKC